jgi:hypothetical protein
MSNAPSHAEEHHGQREGYGRRREDATCSAHARLSRASA